MTVIPQRINSFVYLGQQFRRVRDAFVGHAVREQYDVVVERPTTTDDIKGKDKGKRIYIAPLLLPQTRGVRVRIT